MFQPNLPLRDRVAQLADGRRTLAEIAALCGCHRNTVWRIVGELGLPRLPTHGPSLTGADNAAWRGGRQVRSDAYAYVLAGDHPTTRRDGYIQEHVLVAEQAVGRLLLRTEVVHHRDGLTLHNSPENLQILPRAEHARLHNAGVPKQFSQAGLEALRQARLQPEEHVPVSIVRQRKARGDYRLRQCILIVLKFGPDSPFALGTQHWFEQAGIDLRSRPSLERAWDDLSRRYAEDLLR